MDPEQRALLNAIIANPADDAPRLIYADWLDEHDGQITCPKCNGDCHANSQWLKSEYGICPTCNGIGRVSNLFTERADFIRKQLELPDVDNCFCGIDGHFSDAHIKFDRRLAEMTVDGTALPRRFTYRRGFVYKVTCLMNTWLTHGPEIVRDHPIEYVEITDKSPSYYISYEWNIIYTTRPIHASHLLPKEIFYKLDEKSYLSNKISTPCTYGEDFGKALDDLSQACIAYAKEQH